MMCVEPDFSIHRDQALCTDHDVAAVFVQLGAHWLIAHRRKVRLHAQRLIRSANVCSAGSESRWWGFRARDRFGIAQCNSALHTCGMTDNRYEFRNHWSVDAAPDSA